MSKAIALSFRHGLGDCVHFAHQLPLYTGRGYRFILDCHGSKAFIFRACKGVDLVDERELPRHAWLHGPPVRKVGYEKYFLGNKAGFNVSAPPMPDIGALDEALWKEYCGVRLNLLQHVSVDARQQIDLLVDGLPLPLVLLHTRGNTLKKAKDLEDGVTLELYGELLEATAGTLILLDWDNRVPVAEHPRVRHLLRDFKRALSVEELLALYERASLLIGIDSGPGHLARFSGLPTMLIWRGHHPAAHSIPKENFVHLVPRKPFEELNRHVLRDYSIVECQGEMVSPAEISLQAVQLLENGVPAKGAARFVAESRSGERESGENGVGMISVGKGIEATRLTLTPLGASSADEESAQRVNQRELRMLSLRRSGIHAFANWLVGLFDGKVHFFNDFNHSRASVQADRLSDDLSSLADARRTPARLGDAKDLLLVSWEDGRLIEFRGARLDEAIRGSSQETCEILLLRDPFNMFASRLRLMRNEPWNVFTKDFLLPDASGCSFLPELWRRHAEEFLGITNHLRPNSLRVSYNRWVVDEEYRRSLATHLGVAFRDDYKELVPPYGFGSSFDGLTFQGRASSMDLFNRWRDFKNDPEFCRLFADKRLPPLVTAIFGDEVGSWFEELKHS